MTQRLTRDPNGFPFTRRKATLIQINRSYAEVYDHMTSSGLNRQLIVEDLIARYKEHGAKVAQSPEEAYRVLSQQDFDTPQTYPYEWAFGAWVEGALAVLRIAEIALDHDLVLRRTSPYSMRFDGIRPVWVDPLAFEMYEDGRRWEGYKPFIREWLAPIALMSQVNAKLGMMARMYPAGLPLDVVSAMLPVKTRVNMGLAAHIHMNGREILAGRPNKSTLRDTISGLRDTINGLRWNPSPVAPTTSPDDFDSGIIEHRQSVVKGYIGDVLPMVVWDMAAGDGTFTRMAADVALRVVAFDPNPAAIQGLWEATQTGEVPRVAPVLMDWTTPSPNLGWAYREQRSIASRANPDLLLALDWVHEMVVGSGVPLPRVAGFLAKLAPQAIVEFVPATDPKVIALQNAQSADMTHYTVEAFEEAFQAHYEIMYAKTVHHTERVLYRLRRKNKES
jgi:hypothetical protein